MKVKLGVATGREAGEAAGRVYMYLVSEGPKTDAELVHGMNEKEEALLMALGWLAREDKVEFREDGRVYLKEVTS
jgi:hypothetical protein